jgi:hypothetical protein
MSDDALFASTHNALRMHGQATMSEGRKARVQHWQPLYHLTYIPTVILDLVATFRKRVKKRRAKGLESGLKASKQPKVASKRAKLVAPQPVASTSSLTTDSNIAPSEPEPELESSTHTQTRPTPEEHYTASAEESATSKPASVLPFKSRWKLMSGRVPTLSAATFESPDPAGTSTSSLAGTPTTEVGKLEEPPFARHVPAPATATSAPAQSAADNPAQVKPLTLTIPAPSTIANGRAKADDELSPMSTSSMSDSGDADMDAEGEPDEDIPGFSSSTSYPPSISTVMHA